MNVDAFEKELLGACGGTWMTSHLTSFLDPKARQEDVQRLEQLKERLGEIQTRHAPSGDAAKMMGQAQEHIGQMIETLERYPGRGPLGLLAVSTGLNLVRTILEFAVQRAKGIRELPQAIGAKLDGMTEGMRQVGESLRRSKPEEALKVLDQVLRTARSFRNELARQVDRGLER